MEITVDGAKPKTPIMEYLKTWLAPILTAAVIAFFSAFFGYQISINKLQNKLTSLEESTVALQGTTAALGQEIAKRPGPEQIIHKDEVIARFDSLQRELQGVASQVSEIRQHLLNSKEK